MERVLFRPENCARTISPRIVIAKGPWRLRQSSDFRSEERHGLCIAGRPLWSSRRPAQRRWVTARYTSQHDGIDLAAAITTLTEQIPGTRFRVDIDPGLRVTDIDRAEILLRCAQEGITNALRHGRALVIDVRCREVGERIELSVSNDGPALKPAPFGNGLTGMRERLAAAGGELSLQPRAQGGAELLAAIPAHG
ncbi:MAG: sensor histidine kinase [Pseudomonadota bacterium]|jgi:signal transduction histidine kinase